MDGTKTPRYISDIAIKDGKIAKISGLKRSSAARELDASGLIVAPGFVDLHTHYDAQIQWDPYCTMSGWHGVTSVAIGNCGFGLAPCHEKDRERAMLSLTRTEAIPINAMKAGVSWDWESFPEFLATLARIPKGVNVTTGVPLTPLYGWVMGWEEAKKRRPTEAELKEMCRLINEAMDAGASGWSAQVGGVDSPQRDYDGSPLITDLLTDEEILTFAKVLADRDEGFIELSYRQVGEGGILDEGPVRKMFERVAEASRRPILYQQVEPKNEHMPRLKWVEDCINRGLRVYAQGFTSRSGLEMTFKEWNLFDDSPTWRAVTIGTPEERKQKMQDQEHRQRMREEWDGGAIRPGSNMVGSLEGLLVAEVANPEFEEFEGMTGKQIAEKTGKHVVDAILDLVVADDLNTEFSIQLADPSGRLECTTQIANSPYAIGGVSDGGAHVKFYVAGSFPTDMLVWLVRDEGAVSLEDAHYKLSYFPAFCAGIKDRGYLREGLAADIVVYNLEDLSLKPTEVLHDLPGDEWRRVQRADGYRWTLVNGQITFENGKPTGELPGTLLRNGGG